MYFSPDYFTARSRFRRMLEAAGGRLEVLRLDARGPAGEDLGIDVGFLGPDRPRHILLHSSGLHGVEGFAGSAIQLQLLDNLPEIPSETGLILAHVLNPYGMAWLRRVNENNVDLNRNFLGDARYTGSPESYGAVDSFLNPKSPPDRDFFMLRAQWLILRHGMVALKQAVAGGQYEYPKGLFFGGKRLEEGAAKYKALLERSLAFAERVVTIDVHTGLGNYGEDTLVVEPEDYPSLQQIFGKRVAPSTPEQGPAYRVRGGIHSMIIGAAPQARVYRVCQEFGTYGATRVLRALREENRWEHFGEGTLAHASKQTLKETFSPPDEAWQRSVLSRGAALIRQALDRGIIP